jgi:hypothetical protein
LLREKDFGWIATAWPEYAFVLYHGFCGYNYNTTHKRVNGEELSRIVNPPTANNVSLGSEKTDYPT